MCMYAEGTCTQYLTFEPLNTPYMVNLAPLPSNGIIVGVDKPLWLRHNTRDTDSLIVES